MSNSWLPILLSAGWALLPLALTFSIVGHHQQADPAASLVATCADYPPATRFLLLASGLIGLELLLVCCRRLLRLNTEYLRCQMKTPWFLRLLLILYWVAVVSYAVHALVFYLERQPPGLGAAFANLSEFSYSFRWITNLFLIGIGLELAVITGRNVVAHLMSSGTEQLATMTREQPDACGKPTAIQRLMAGVHRMVRVASRHYLVAVYLAIASAVIAAVQLGREIYWFAYSEQHVGAYMHATNGYFDEFGGLGLSSPLDQIAYRLALLAILALSLLSMGIILKQQRRELRLLGAVVMVMISACVFVIPDLTMQGIVGVTM